MWTPKRILLLALGGLFFCAFFVLYAYFLGGIDGLPSLPSLYDPLPIDSTSQIEPPPAPPPISDVDHKLLLSFGNECPEYKYTIKIEVKQRGLVLACNNLNIEKDGRVKLTPFSIAIFKDRGDDTFPEINTVRAESAWLRFDEPIKDPTDMGHHKIVGAELRGGRDPISVSNNRRTLQKSDDVEVRISQEPLFFDDKTSKVWTEGFVKLTDFSSRPQPTTISGKGLDLHLTKDSGQPGKDAPAGRNKNNTNISGVDLIVLHSNVEMYLWVDARSGFLASGQQQQHADAPRTNGNGEPEKSQVIIRTQGPFSYDLARDFAEFQTPPLAAEGKVAERPPFPETVMVTRETFQGEARFLDQLVCDHLRLQFRKKAEVDAKVVRDNPSADREIETAHATARPGTEVTLSADTEHLDAHGTELVYRSAIGSKGTETILRGSPMWAIKDAHKITAKELHLLGPDVSGAGQQATAQGPGKIDLLDRNNGAKVHQYHALWQDTLVVTKDREGDKTLDLLTFNGDAAFKDDIHEQDMRAERIQVWLEPPEREDATARPKPAQQTTAPDAPRQRPHKVEAFEHVTVQSPELRIKECEHLIVIFKDGPAEKLPDLLPPVSDGAPVASAAPQAGGPVPAPAPGVTARTAGTAGASVPDKTRTDGSGGLVPGQKADPNRKPIDLWARQVVVNVVRAGDKNDLQHVQTYGSVHVRQAAAKPEDKGVDIKGEILNLDHYLPGDVLIVFGDSRGPAQLQLGELFLVGPKVTLNQKDNMAEVEGVGAMHMPSNTTFDGGTPKNPGTRLTVHWTRDMLFNGKDADFHGGVVAYQDNASLRCQTLQVTLDKVVSFKEGQKSSQGAKVEKMVCDRKVYVADTTRDEKGVLTRYQRLISQELTMDNKQGPVIGTGPGKVYLLQYGSSEETTGDANNKKPAPQELYLTRVDFQGRMFSNNKDQTRTAKFYDNVEVFHLPSDNPDTKIDLDHLNKNDMYMRCERLTVYTRPMGAGKTAQYMLGEQNVLFRTKEFYGRSQAVKYDQPQEQVIFEGSPGNLVTIWRFRGVGVPPEQFTGEKILYKRRTGEFQVMGGKLISTTPSH